MPIVVKKITIPAMQSNCPKILDNEYGDGCE